MAKNFRADQLEVQQIILSGGINSPNGGERLGAMIYSGSNPPTSNREGGRNRPILVGVGKDVMLFVSGNLGGKDQDFGSVTLFGGDVVVSGTMYMEQLVTEVSRSFYNEQHVSGTILLSNHATAAPKVTTINPGDPTLTESIDISIGLISGGDSAYDPPAGEGAIAFDYMSGSEKADALIWEGAGNLYCSASRGIVFIAGSGSTAQDNNPAHIYNGVSQGTFAFRTAPHSPNAGLIRNRFIIFSGSDRLPGTPPEFGFDTNFYVSGNVGGRNGMSTSIGVFGGDLHVSGNLSVDGGGGGEWTRASGDLHPTTNPTSTDVLIGDTTEGDAHIVLKSDGGATFNKQGDSVQFVVESVSFPKMLQVHGGGKAVSVGKQLNAPEALLHVASEGAGGGTSDVGNNLFLQRSTGNADPAFMGFFKTRGDVSSHGDLLSGDRIGAIQYLAKKPGATSPALFAQVDVTSYGTVSNSSTPAHYIISTVANGETAGHVTAKFGGTSTANPGGTISGSIHQTVGGKSYLKEGTGIGIASGSDGSIVISLAGGGGQWTDTSEPGGDLHPADSSGEQNVLIGGTSLGAADIILKKEGGAEFNFQSNTGPSSDFLVWKDSQGAGKKILIGAHPIHPFTNRESVLILSGGFTGHPDPARYTDTTFFVSGSCGHRNSTDGGVSAFGGDVVISGSLAVLETCGTGGSISGSIHQTADGKSYIAAGTNVTVVSGSDGQITISSTGGGGSSEWTDESNSILRPADSSGDRHVAIGGTGTNLAGYDILLKHDGESRFNQSKNSAGDFAVSTPNKTSMIQSDAGRDALYLNSTAGLNTADSSLQADISVLIGGSVESKWGSSRGAVLHVGDTITSGSITGLHGRYSNIRELTYGANRPGGTALNLLPSDHYVVLLSSAGVPQPKDYSVGSIVNVLLPEASDYGRGRVLYIKNAILGEMEGLLVTAGTRIYARTGDKIDGLPTGAVGDTAPLSHRGLGIFGQSMQFISNGVDTWWIIE